VNKFKIFLLDAKGKNKGKSGKLFSTFITTELL